MGAFYYLRVVKVMYFDEPITASTVSAPMDVRTVLSINGVSTIPGLFVIGEANFSDHGANRLGASALMQGLSDGHLYRGR